MESNFHGDLADIFRPGSVNSGDPPGVSEWQYLDQSDQETQMIQKSTRNHDVIIDHHQGFGQPFTSLLADPLILDQPTSTTRNLTISDDPFTDDIKEIVALGEENQGRANHSLIPSNSIHQPSPKSHDAAGVISPPQPLARCTTSAAPGTSPNPRLTPHTTPDHLLCAAAYLAEPPLTPDDQQLQEAVLEELKLRRMPKLR
ncbi:hypothetical protein HanIR_Chr04g0192851 [Helianthus annuus]|nr:hypothetical protein HanIR_Chr04g0192851 [Helianthus annuus]